MKISFILLQRGGSIHPPLQPTHQDNVHLLLMWPAEWYLPRLLLMTQLHLANCCIQCLSHPTECEIDKKKSHSWFQLSTHTSYTEGLPLYKKPACFQIAPVAELAEILLSLTWRVYIKHPIDFHWFLTWDSVWLSVLVILRVWLGGCCFKSHGQQSDLSVWPPERGPEPPITLGIVCPCFLRKEGSLDKSLCYINKHEHNMATDLEMIAQALVDHQSYSFYFHREDL